jgi:hypothetical protein
MSRKYADEFSHPLAQSGPKTISNTTYLTAYIDASKWEQLVAYLIIGTNASAAHLIAKFRCAKDAAGTGVQDVPSGATTDDATADKLHRLVLDTSMLPNGFNWVCLSVTESATQTATYAELIEGFFRKDGRPASDSTNAALVETIKVR